MTLSLVNHKYRNAHEVLVKHWDRRLPVDPRKIATSLGMEVKEIDLSGDDKDISGKFQMEGEQPVVYYNSNEPDVRIRFTIAHEIGHYILGHGDALRDPASNFKTGVYNYKEIEANNFAAQLLMPEGVVVDDVRRGKKINSLKDLSNRYDVSQFAMIYRLKNLGLIP